MTIDLCCRGDTEVAQPQSGGSPGCLRRLQRLLKARPTMLLRDGQVRHAALRRAPVAESEIRQAARSHGAGDLSELAAVVLGTDRSLSVIPSDRLGDASSLIDVLDHAG
ncbi:hypothetical protein KBX71_03220 [Micromonospora sp. D93]|uniref:YetF domain-containing protein n=1 Tax=Micromonospora sp. D93 TaxID=2824886 RepID=UPI001B36E035|nr:YetF domain-containing protein [Micromonospora sp. D93]MBQ1016872.1 hypothetical protein [Micromonospora sp. D93]